MSVVEDTRKIVQDFVAPELRGIAARLDGLDKRVDLLDKKVDEVDRRSEKRDEALAQKIDKLDAKVEDYAKRTDAKLDMIMEWLRQASDVADMKERLARIEERQRPIDRKTANELEPSKAA